MRVAAQHDQARLDRCLADGLPALSRTRLKALIEDGRVSIGGETIAEPSYRVKRGQDITVRVPPPADETPRGEAIPLAIVYEDDDVIVVDKPAGLVVHPAPGHRAHTLVNALIAHCGATLSGIGGVRRPGIVHRLDKDTSGLLVAAKHDVAHRGLADQFAARALSRAYLAIVWGRPSPAQGEISGAIGRSPRNRKKMAVVQAGGKPALTRYRLIRPLGEAWSLVRCDLASGRTHQIRVHMASRGHPVVGDALYGGVRGRGRLTEDEAAALASCQRQALHAFRLRFTHPVSGELCRFESALPSDLERLLRVGDGGDTAPGPPTITS